MNAINRNRSGTLNLKIDFEDFKRFFHAGQLGPGDQAVLSINKGSLEAVKEWPSDQIIRFIVIDRSSDCSRQYRIKRRDYKRMKLYLEGL